MSTPAFADDFTDSATAGGGYGYGYDDGDGDDRNDGAPSCAIADFAPYDVRQLRRVLQRFLTVSDGGAPSALTTLPEPGLYALAAALAHPALAGVDRPAGLPAALGAEIRQRSGQGMGSDPTGPVRRGRLLQQIGAFTTLAAPGASPLQRRKLLGNCPFCRTAASPPAAASFQVTLPPVRWQCFACARRGGLPEFAGYLLTDGVGIIPPASSAG